MTVWDVAAAMLLLVFVHNAFLLSSNISFVLCRLFLFFCFFLFVEGSRQYQRQRKGQERSQRGHARQVV